MSEDAEGAAAPWLDVTRALRPGHPNWPGDVPFELTVNGRIAEGSSVNVGSLCTSLHSGTHVDAPWHYDDDGVRLGAVDLRRWLGEALVVDVTGGSGPVQADELAEAVGDVDLPARLLIHTGEPDDWGQEFPTQFRALEPEAIEWAAARGVGTIGTDAPSVDPLTSTSLPGHAACAENDVLIIEGLALAQVRPGRYELVCLPLSLPEADASPARALLRPL